MLLQPFECFKMGFHVHNTKLLHEQRVKRNAFEVHLEILLSINRIIGVWTLKPLWIKAHSFVRSKHFFEDFLCDKVHEKNKKKELFEKRN